MAEPEPIRPKTARPADGSHARGLQPPVRCDVGVDAVIRRVAVCAHRVTPSLPYSRIHKRLGSGSFAKFFPSYDKCSGARRHLVSAVV